MIVCKLCLFELNTIEEHVHHFDMCHKVSLKSHLQCGFLKCTGRVKDLESYRFHFKEFHSTSQAPSDASDGFCKCPHLNCNYKVRSKSSLRAHIFWQHSNGSQQVPEAACAQPSEAFDLESLDLGPNVPHCEPQPNINLHEASKKCDMDIFLKKFVHLGLSLTSKFHVPDSTLAYILQSYGLLIKENTKISAGVLKQKLTSLGLDDDVCKNIIYSVLEESPLEKMHAPNGPMRSFYMRKQQYSKLFPVVSPVQRDLGLNKYNEQSFCHYVKVKDSLKMFLNDDSVYEQYLSRQNRPSVLSEDLYDLTSGTCFENHRLFSHDPTALQLIVYHDDFEICNTIGPAGGTYKVTHMSYTLANLHPWNRSKVDPLQLMMLCKEKDVAWFGYDVVLQPIIAELIDLEENGVEIRGHNVKASVLVLLGDNLGTHSICGFSEGFSNSHYFCRYCEESREEWKKRWYSHERTIQSEDVDSSSDSESENEESDDEAAVDEEGIAIVMHDDEDDDILLDYLPLAQRNQYLHKNKAPLRTVKSYEECVADLENHPGGVKGVVGKAEFNKLKNYHIINGTPPCLPHDLLEGVVAHDLLLCLKVLKKKTFSWDWLNRKLKAFKFEGTDKLDKPPAKFSTERKKIKGSAVQTWVLLRFITLLIGEKVSDKSNPVWRMILLLTEVLQLLTSPVISKSVLPYISTLIYKYLHLRTTLFKVPIRPKHHFFEHYDVLTKIFGPLMKSSTLRFESKHKFFRSEMSAKKCMVNPTLTLATAAQKLQSSLTLGNMFEMSPVVEDPISFDSLSIEVSSYILAVLGREITNNLLFSKRIIFQNTTYKEGDVIVVSTAKHPDMDCCKINVGYSDGKTGFVIGVKCVATLVPDMMVYTLKETSVLTLIALDRLKDFAPYSIYSHSEKNIIVLKHLYLQRN